MRRININLKTYFGKEFGNQKEFRVIVQIHIGVGDGGKFLYDTHYLLKVDSISSGSIVLLVGDSEFIWVNQPGHNEKVFENINTSLNFWEADEAEVDYVTDGVYASFFNRRIWRKGFF